MNIENNYFKVPNDIFELELTPTQFVVLSLILRHTNNGQKSFFSYEYLSQKCKIALSTAKRTIKELIKLGHIEKEVRVEFKDGKQYNQTNQYQVIGRVLENCKPEKSWQNEMYLPEEEDAELCSDKEDSSDLQVENQNSTNEQNKINVQKAREIAERTHASLISCHALVQLMTSRNIEVEVEKIVALYEKYSKTMETPFRFIFNSIAEGKVLE